MQINYFIKYLCSFLMLAVFANFVLANTPKPKPVQKPTTANRVLAPVIPVAPAPKIIDNFKTPNNPLFSGLQIFIQDGDLLETPQGVEVTISNGIIDYYGAGFVKHFEIIKGIPQINEKEYAGDFMRALLKPFGDRVKILVTANANISISQTDIRKTNVKKLSNQLNAKSYWVPVQNGKILTISESTTQMLQYEGGLIKFTNGSKQ